MRKPPYLLISKTSENNRFSTYDILKGSEFYTINVGENYFEKKYNGKVNREVFSLMGTFIRRPSKKFIFICQNLKPNNDEN